jgi:hypothetical protein
MIERLKRPSDVVVVGGGTAGWAAALAAARAGRSVLVIDRKGYPGGALGTGLPIHGFANARHQQVVAGIAAELVERLGATGGASPLVDTDLWFAKYVLTNPAAVKAAILEMLDEAGAEMLFFAQMTGVLRDGGRVAGVVVQTRSGPELIEGRTFVDATGDAVLCLEAGAPMLKLEALQPPSLVFRIENVDLGALRRHLADHPGDFMSGRMLPGRQISREFLDAATFFFVFPDLVREVPFKGEYSPYINRFMFTATPDDRGVVVNMLRALHVDGTRSESLTRATVDMYRNLVPLVEFFRRRIPGFARCSLCDSEPEIQLRETRRIEGEYTLTADDVTGGRFFEDTIAVGGYFIDIHSSTDSAGTWKLLEEPYGIPYRALLPRGVENVVAAGRCISGEREAAASYRVMATCMATGQAAGEAAALAASGESGPGAGRAGSLSAVDPQELRRRLRARGAIVEM